MFYYGDNVAKIIVMTGHKHRLVSQVLLKLYLSNKYDLDSIIVENRRKTFKKIVNRFILKGIKYTVHVSLKKILHSLFGNFFAEDIFSLQAALEYTDIDKYTVADHNSDECIEILKRIKPDIIIFAGCRLIKPEVFNLANISSVNIHGHDIEKIRGSGYPGFWENLHHYDEFGITIHKVTKELDQGDILYKGLYPLKNTNLKTISSVFFEEAPVCLIKGLDNLLDDSFISKRQNLNNGKYFTQPSKYDFRNYRKKIGISPF